MRRIVVLGTLLLSGCGALGLPGTGNWHIRASDADFQSYYASRSVTQVCAEWGDVKFRSDRVAIRNRLETVLASKGVARDRCVDPNEDVGRGSGGRSVYVPPTFTPSAPAPVYAPVYTPPVRTTPRYDTVTCNTRERFNGSYKTTCRG